MIKSLRATLALLSPLNRYVAGAHPSITEVGEKRRIALQAWTAVALFVLYIMGVAGGVAANGLDFPDISLLILAAFCAAAYLLNRSRWYLASGWVVVGSLLAFGFFLLLSGPEKNVYSLYSFIPLALVLGSMMLSGWGMVAWLAIVLAAMLAVGAAPGINGRDVGTAFGDFMVLGVLLWVAVAFRNNTERQRLVELQEANQALAQSRGELEERVAERTAAAERRNLYLALATEIGQNVAQVRALDTMLQDAAEIIRAFFGLYYVQVYLVNPSQTELVLQIGTGTVGAELMARNHRLPLDDTSINGRAALSLRTVVIADTTSSAFFRPNPLLPETRSEMAVPLAVGSQLIGVLDMQSSQAGMLGEEALIAFEPLAGQLAVAIQNARLIAETERARNELQSLARRLTRSGWDEYLDAVHQPELTGFSFANDQMTPISETVQNTAFVTAPLEILGTQIGTLTIEPHTAVGSGQGEAVQNTASAIHPRADDLAQGVARQIAQQIENLRLLNNADRYRAEAEEAMRRLTRQAWQDAQGRLAEEGYLYHDHRVKPLGKNEEAVDSGQLDAVQNTAALTIRDESIGEITLLGAAPLSESEQEMLTSVSQQLAAHIENLRLAQETQTALTRTEGLYTASARVIGATTVEGVLKAVVESTALREFDYGSILLFERPRRDAQDTQGEAIVAGVWGQSAIGGISTGGRLPIVQLAFATQRNREHPTFIRDVEADPKLDAEMRAQMRQTGRAMAVFPLTASDQWIGELVVTREQPAELSEDEMRQIESLAAQAATVVQSIRLYEQAQNLAQREKNLRQITSLVRGSTDPETILRTAARELGKSLGRKVGIRLEKMAVQDAAVENGERYRTPPQEVGSEGDAERRQQNLAEERRNNRQEAAHEENA